MASVQEWFTAEMQRLGFAGLESVYDYVASMSDQSALDYLRSLLGSAPSIQDFAKAYLKNRATGKAGSNNQSPSPATPFDASLTTWASNSASSSTAGSKKSRRGKGKGRGGTSKGAAQKEGKPSFAGAVSNDRNSLAKSAQAIAIKNSPVEIARQKVREYRLSRKPINCIKCGKIEKIVREDGACSFCGAAIFAIWERKERTVSDDSDDERDSLRHRRGNKKEGPMPIVLGRYVFPSKASKEGVVVVPSRTKDLAGQPFPREDSKRCGVKEGKASGSVEGFYRNPLIEEKDLDALCKSAEAKLKTIIGRGSNVKDASTLQVRGILQIDNLSPSVCLYDL